MALAWSSKASPVTYSASAKLMHWFIAAAVIVLLALGPVMKRLVPEGSLRDNLYTFHEALGALVLIVMVVRLARRAAFGVPAPDASMPPAEQRASLWAQYALYALLLVTTVLGWAGTNAYGDPVSVFGLFDFPAIIGKDQPLSDRCDRRASYRGRALPSAHQARSRLAAHAARKLTSLDSLID
jgi:cytochrome b561